MENRDFREVYIDFIKSGGNMELLPEGYYIKVPYYNIEQIVFLCNDKGYSKKICKEMLDAYKSLKETN